MKGQHLCKMLGLHLCLLLSALAAAGSLTASQGFAGDRAGDHLVVATEHGTARTVCCGHERHRFACKEVGARHPGPARDVVHVCVLCC